MRLLVGRDAHTKLSRHARAGGHPVRRSFSINHVFLGVLDRPLEPVIGLAEGETRWRAMTAERAMTA
jgi:hypothetical protein